MTDSAVSDQILFHPLKKIEIIVTGETEPFVRRLLDDSGVSGYTLIRDVAGKGHHRFQEGRLLFNDQASLVMLLAVAPENAIRRIAAGLAPLFRKQSGVMFISDVQVVRLEHFTRPEAG
ncbi:MAG: transcriptional regulator [Tistrella sp.]|mgnify:FL=1|nr:P-II family nitrogen regulator [Tistrella sp.]MAD37513.1 transcriptional regulator [Tistrella sp.]MBA76043.1 transcriptional regulator [Tistrella sp.]|tara:strand:+ start:192 stop:548 length:357 start_codon:yes stop_codon:yes gene_type:complete